MKPARIFGALGATSAVATVAVVVSGVAAADKSEAMRVSSLKERPPAQLSTAAKRVAASPSLADFDPAPEKARSVRPPREKPGAWALMPAADGACLVAPSDTITCGTTKSINAGRFLAFSAPNALPEKLSASQLKDVQAGKPVRAPGALAGSTVTGIVPDEAVAVALLDRAGETIAKSSVVDNLYRVSDVDMSAVATVRLIHADGSSTDTQLR